VGAQGINAGLQDAANLGWKLARVASRSSDPWLLATYDAERRPAARATVQATDRTTRLGTLKAPAAVATREALWRVAARHGVVDRRIAPAAAGLSQRLAQSAASPRRPLALRTSPGAGALLPDLRLPGHGPDEAWLSDVLSGSGFAVLLVGLEDAGGGSDLAGQLPADVAVVQVVGCVTGSTPGPGLRVVADPDERVASALRVRAASLFVVRPDRHIAVRRPASSLATAIGHAVRYLDHIGKGGPCRAPEK
jgi:3-(3-hydroxy-phenyl)propionate hydroxylase